MVRNLKGHIGESSRGVSGRVRKKKRLEWRNCSKEKVVNLPKAQVRKETARKKMDSKERIAIQLPFNNRL